MLQSRFTQTLAHDEKEFVPMGRVRVPREFGFVIFDDEREAPTSEFAFEVRDGIPQCRQVTVTATEGGREVTSSVLAEVRVRDAMEKAIVALLGVVPVLEDGRPGWPSRLFATEDERHRAKEESQRARRVRLTHETLREVASVYRANVDDRPTVAVANHFDRDTRTARLYLKAARDRVDPETGKHFLGMALKGKAGEQ